MNIRRGCPKCGVAMDFIWPSPQKDERVEAVIGNYQRCRNGCGQWMGNVDTGREHSIRREGQIYHIDGKSYTSLAQWLFGE